MRRVVFAVGSAFVTTAAFLWARALAPGMGGHRMANALRRCFLFRGLGLVFMVQAFPSVIGGNLTFVTETLSISGQGSELADRTWDYPVQKLLGALWEDWIVAHDA